MTSFEFVADKEAEGLIYSAFLSVWESIYYRDLFSNMEGTMQGVWTLENPGFPIYITKSEYKDLIVEEEAIKYRDSPVIVYRYPTTRDDGLCAPGRLAYLGEKAFPAFKKEYNKILRVIKRHFWYCKDWSVWVPISMGEMIHAYIPNRVVVLRKESGL